MGLEFCPVGEELIKRELSYVGAIFPLSGRIDGGNFVDKHSQMQPDKFQRFQPRMKAKFRPFHLLDVVTWPILITLLGQVANDPCGPLRKVGPIEHDLPILLEVEVRCHVGQTDQRKLSEDTVLGNGHPD